MRKLGLTIYTILLSGALLLAGCSAQPASNQTGAKQGDSPKKVYKIGVTQIVDHPALNLDQKGFLDEMKAQGFVPGENAEFIVKSAQGDPNLAKTIADQFVAEKVDLIAAISTPSAQAAYMATKNTGIPVVYIAVTDPVRAGIIQEFGKPTGTNISGVYNGLPIDKQMDLIQEIQPSLKALGIIYNAGEDNSVSIKDRVKAYLKDKVNIVEVTVTSSSEVQAAAQSLVGRVDAVYMPNDNTVMSALETLVKVAQDNDIAFYSGDMESVKRGALATIGNDEYDAGVQGAIMAAKVLNGKAVGEIPSELVRKYALIANKKAAAKYGITIPQSVLERADEIIE